MTTAIFILAGLAFAIDFDNDGLPDEWEIAYGYSTNGYAFSNLVIWAQMDQSGGSVTDRSLNNLNGTIHQFSDYVPGLFSNALSFSSNTWVGFPVGGVAQLQFSDATGNAQTVKGAVGALDIADNQWHHVAGVYQKGAVTNAWLYVDGLAEAGGPISNWGPSSAQSFTLGNSQFVISNLSFFVDEFRLYNTALDESGVVQLPVTHTDLDGDGLSTLEEYQLGTNPNNGDSDGDGIGDGVDPIPNVYGTLSVTNGLKLWLRADAGISNSNGFISWSSVFVSVNLIMSW